MPVELTERELAVLRRFADQQTNAEIARDLILSVGTVKWYAQQIYNKLSVSDRKAAVARAQAMGLLHNLSADESVSNTPEDVPNYLPAQFTSFVGREADVDHVCHLLMQNRFVTLTGPGGVGKTRLAIQCAGEMSLSGILCMRSYNQSCVEKGAGDGLRSEVSGRSVGGIAGRLPKA